MAKRQIIQLFSDLSNEIGNTFMKIEVCHKMQHTTIIELDMTEKEASRVMMTLARLDKSDSRLIRDQALDAICSDKDAWLKMEESKEKYHRKTKKANTKNTDTNTDTNTDN